MEIKSAFSRVALAACACLIGLAVPFGTVAAGEQLVFFNWSEYMDPELLAEFTAETGFDVVEAFYASDSDRDSRLAQSDGGEFDVVVISAESLTALRNWGWLAPLTVAEVPNARHIDERWQIEFPVAQGVGVPYFWGTTGIVYRIDAVDSAITHWSQILTPSDALCGKLWMLDDTREDINLTLIALGHDFANPSSAQLDDARRLLLQQKPCVAAYDYPDVTENSQLLSGEVSAAVVFNGDAQYYLERDSDLRFVVPAEGTVLWVDYLVVPASSQNKDAAYALIDFLNRPSNAARLAAHVNFATANIAAMELLPQSYLENSVIYPTDDVIERAVIETQRPARTLRRFNTIGQEMLSGRGDRP